MTAVSLPGGLEAAVSAILERWPALVPPAPSLDRSVRVRVAGALFRTAVRRLPVTVELPGGRTLGRGGPRMRLHRPAELYARIGRHGLIGFGESYMAGDWDADDLAAFLEPLAREIATLVPTWMQRMRPLFVRRQPGRQENTVDQTRGNIAHHYDLSNDLFATFLDESMTYSSALFADLGAEEDLATAQRRKLDRLLDAAGVGPGSRVLEIGTGWGELALRAAARGATVHSVTLSSEQLELARQRVAEAGYDDRVTLELTDYRHVQGRYDAVVSVEMIEAVGHDFLATYFQTIDRVLAPGGRVAIQAITMPHERMLATKDTWTWIHKYIFPGGFLPSTELLAEVTERHTGLRVTQRLSLGAHYARTLRTWDRAFCAAHERVAALGFDHVFERMWHFYLCYSEAGFASRYLDVQQIVLDRSGDDR